MSIPFYCSPQVVEGVTSGPSAEDMRLRGGTYTNNVFTLNNGDQVGSTSKACKTCMVRDGDTNQWQGPRHLVLFIDGRWIPFAATPFYRGKKPIILS